MSDELSVWVVYDHPADYPDHYVARRWMVVRGSLVPTSDMLWALDLELIRLDLDGRGLVSVARSPEDPSSVIETWL